MTDKALEGPYSFDNGQDGYGHPTNSYGRCQQLNETGVCPTQAQETARLMGRSNDWLVDYAGQLGITIPLVHPNSVLVPLIIAVLFPVTGIQGK
jgi:hypothetical protein